LPWKSTQSSSTASAFCPRNKNQTLHYALWHTTHTRICRTPIYTHPAPLRRSSTTPAAASSATTWCLPTNWTLLLSGHGADTQTPGRRQDDMIFFSLHSPLFRPCRPTDRTNEASERWLLGSLVRVKVSFSGHTEELLPSLRPVRLLTSLGARVGWREKSTPSTQACCCCRRHGRRFFRCLFCTHALLPTCIICMCGPLCFFDGICGR
jgi:hypothetical protein